MSNLDKLISHFESFPGIGGRQARRFAFHILTLPPETVTELAELITTLPETVTECDSCRRFFSRNGGSLSLCSICNDPQRNLQRLMVVERDSDIQAIERSGSYDGLYFVLGGTVPLLSTAPSGKIRGGALKTLVESRLTHDELQEVILAFSINPDGENTGRYVRALINEVPDGNTLQISELGRGLSTGSELEYADPETIKSALLNRH